VAAGRAVFRTLAGHLDVTAERQRADPVLRLAATEAHDGRIETELELQHSDPDALCGEEMPEFVHEDQHAQHEQECEKCRHSGFQHQTSEFTLPTSDFTLRASSSE
jgi:hypothetical protein